MFDDAEYRDTFKRMIERESLVIKRVLEDLRNIAQPIPLEHFPVDIDRSVADVVESLKVPAETAGVNLRAELGSVGALIQGDVFALGRVYRNLLINAIQATAPGGDVAIATEATADRVRVRVQRHRLRHRPGPDRRHLRRFRDDQTARARAGPRDLEEDRRAARRTDLGRRARSARARRSSSNSRAPRRGRSRSPPARPAFPCGLRRGRLRTKIRPPSPRLRRQGPVGPSQPSPRRRRPLTASRSLKAKLPGPSRRS